jgi:hypothetical protein
VEAGIFHDFHHAWIEEIKRSLNNGILPSGYYALAEQIAGGIGPDVIALQAPEEDGRNGAAAAHAEQAASKAGLLVVSPKVTLTSEADRAYYRRKKSTVVIRHVTGDDVVAMVEIVSPGNKDRKRSLQAFVEKAGSLLDQSIHLLVLDVLPPGRFDPNGIHGAIWEAVAGEDYTRPQGKPLTLVGYESGLAFRAYIEPLAVGDTLIDMPLFLEPGAHVPVPCEATYQRAFAAVPRRWQVVLQ